MEKTRAKVTKFQQKDIKKDFEMPVDEHVATPFIGTRR
jgi:hypothetical protein